LYLTAAGGVVLVRRQDVIDRAGLNKNTLNDKPRFEEVGKRKTYIELGEIAAVKSRKGTRKRVKS
jgi:hypothetical protein